MKKKNNQNITVNHNFEKDQHLTDLTVIKVTLNESTGEQNGVVVLSIHPGHGLQMCEEMRSGRCHEAGSEQGTKHLNFYLLLSCLVLFNGTVKG